MTYLLFWKDRKNFLINYNSYFIIKIKILKIAWNGKVLIVSISVDSLKIKILLCKGVYGFYFSNLNWTK